MQGRRWLCVAAALLVSGAWAQFEGDSRLDEAISVRAEAESVRDVLKGVSDQLGVRLVVSKPIEGDLVILYCKDRPAREVLSIIAEHFGWTWKQEDGGYRLYQTASSRRDEEKQREAIILRKYLKMQEAARKRIKQAEESDLAAVEAQIADLEEQSSEAAGSVRSQISNKIQQLRTLLRPSVSVSDKLIAGLSRDQLLELDRRSRLVFAQHPTPSQYQLLLSRNDVREVVALTATLREKERTEYEERIGRTPTLWHYRRISPDDVANVRFEVSVSMSSGQPYASVSCNIALLDREGRILTTERGGSLSYGQLTSGWQTDEKPESRERNRLDQAAFLTEDLKNALAKDEYGRLTVVSEGRIAFRRGEPKAEPLRGLGKLLIAVADAGGVSLVSDIYDSHYWVSRSTAPDAATPGTLLDALSEQMRADWQMDGDWVKVRTRDWPLCRYETAPRDLLFSTRDQRLKQTGLTLDQTAAVAARVNDHQARGPLLFLLVALSGSSWLERGGGNLYMLRLWDAIGPMGRKVLTEGGRLEYGRLTPSAQSLFGEVLYRTRTYLYYAGYPALGDPGEAQNLEWAKATWGDPGPETDTEITQILPNGPSAQSTVELRRADRQGLYLKYEGGAVTYRGTLMYALDTSMSPDGRSPFEGLDHILAVESKHMFTFRLRPQVVRGVVLRSATPAPGARFGPYSALPEEVRKRIAEFLDRYRGGGGT
ncbi:MAG: hypothetical protein IH851_06115 [Armatimonadetes bacterium]|nr:hypothetical protein [Armatimonadota bacterium]